MKKRVHLVISGDVHGVGFRHFVRQKALEHNLTGWVRNTPEGGVEVVAEGEEDKLSNLIDVCRTGPLLAVVKDITLEWQEFTGGFHLFCVRN